VDNSSGNNYTGEFAVEASGLTKHYGDVVALDGLDLSVPTGTVLGLLGPNGAGKTTAVSILTTLIAPDGGTARVAGVDVIKEPQRVRSLIGLSGQYAAVDEHLTATENLEMIGCLYGMRRPAARKKASELIERFRLGDSAHRPLKTFSGGMRAGTTVVLTTQYLEEADQLAHDIVVIDHGRAIARGTSQELKRRIGGEHLDIHLALLTDISRVEAIVRPFAIGAIRTDDQEVLVSIPVSKGIEALGSVMAELTAQNIEIVDIGLRRPTLDDVFMELTGHKTQEEQP
jgi:ABC-2 type transport system ATP-binding protein